MKKQLLLIITCAISLAGEAQSPAACFNAGINYSAGPSPFTVTSADFNGDGNMDLAVANFASNSVSVLMGSSTGTFAAAVSYSVGSNPFSVTSGDFNGDGKADLAVANTNSGSISVLLGSGTGVFGVAVNYPVVSTPRAVISGDFNGDGNADLAVANGGLNGVSILLGSGSGTFGSAVYYGTGSSPSSVTSGDFNGDGKADLAVANNSSNNMSVLLGSGTGSFGLAVNYFVGLSPQSITNADFNGDGVADLVIANSAANNVSVLLGSGTGTFGSAVNYGCGVSPFSVTSADFNGDGKTDLAVANQNSNNVSLLLGSGTGTFGSAVHYAVGSNPISVTNADFNGDGNVDLAIANSALNSVSVLLNCAVFPNGRALNFDGTNDVVNCGPAIASALANSPALTVEAWVRPTSSVGAGAIISNHSTGTQFSLRRTASNNYEFFIGSGTHSIVTAVGTSTTNVWQHVAAVFNKTSMAIYINGVLSTSTIIPTYFLVASTASVQIGNNASNEAFHGDIDEVRVWNRALCQGEIQNNKNGEIPTFSNGLLANYHFNQGISGGNNLGVTTLIDASGNGHTGTLLNMALLTTTSNWTSPGAVSGSVTPFVSPIISVNSGTICSSQVFTINPIGATTYSIQGASSIVSPTANATYTVVGYINGCISNQAISSVTVNALPTISVNSGAICAGQSFTMTPSGATAYSYSSGSSIVSPAAYATYTVTGTNIITGCSNIAVSSVTVNTLPTVIALTNNTLLCAGQTATLSVSGAATYTWSNTENTMTVAITPTTQTTYTVNGTDANGCVNSASITQSVSLCTSVNQIASISNEFMVYPNPLNGVFNVIVSTLTKISILDVLGKVVYAESFDSGKNQIDFNHHTAGIYFLKAENNGLIKTIRLIKK